jgi:hypothetical protein
VGGGEHDWGFLFGEWNVLAYSERIGHDVRMAGGAIMLAATIWGVREALRPTAQISTNRQLSGTPR